MVSAMLTKIGVQKSVFARRLLGLDRFTRTIHQLGTLGRMHPGWCTGWVSESCVMRVRCPYTKQLHITESRIRIGEQHECYDPHALLVYRRLLSRVRRSHKTDVSPGRSVDVIDPSLGEYFMHARFARSWDACEVHLCVRSSLASDLLT